MDLTNLTLIVTFILALSVAGERLAEIFKGWFKELNVKRADETAENRRQTFVRILALFCSLLASGIFFWTVPDNGIISSWPAAIGYGILASGGSSLWNSVLGYFKNMKEIKDSIAKQTELANEQQRINMRQLTLNDTAVVQNLRSEFTTAIDEKFKTLKKVALEKVGAP
jgi:hypothetical protein